MDLFFRVHTTILNVTYLRSYRNLLLSDAGKWRKKIKDIEVNAKNSTSCKIEEQVSKMQVANTIYVVHATNYFFVKPRIYIPFHEVFLLNISC